jgi:hypothetical protein
MTDGRRKNAVGLLLRFPPLVYLFLKNKIKISFFSFFIIIFYFVVKTEERETLFMFLFLRSLINSKVIRLFLF